MANAAIAYRNLADAGTLSASTAESAMPVSRLQNEHVGKRWRSTAEPAWLLCDLLSHASIDTIALLGVTAGATSSIRVRVSADNDEYTKVLLRMDGADGSTTFTDTNAGGSAHTWTASGNAQIDTAKSKFGGASGLFDGTGDYISTPDHADFTLGSDDFTIDFWFYVNFAGGSAKYPAGQVDAAGAANVNSAWYFSRSAANVISAVVISGTTQTAVTGTTQFTNAVNTGWHHCALVRTGNTLKLFIDGVQEGGDVAFSSTINNSTGNLTVGRLGDTAFPAWLGWIDEFRLSVGIARWTANFTPPQAAADGTGAAGDLYDATFDASDAQYDPDYGAFVLPIAAPVSARFVRLDITDTPASYVEAGRLFIGLREAFTYNFSPGAGVTWADRSRKTISAGGQTLIFPDNKVRSVELNFEWVTKAQRNGLIESIDLVNGQSVDVLLILDTDSDNLARDSIFGLISAPAANLYSPIADIFSRAYRIEERK